MVTICRSTMVEYRRREGRKNTHAGIHGHSCSLAHTASPRNGMKAKQLQGCPGKRGIEEAKDRQVSDEYLST